MPTYASCPDCDWSAEADDRTDAHRAELNHWDAAHAPQWCHFCEPAGPAYKRRDHDQCIHQALVGTWLDEQPDHDEVPR